MSPKPLVAVIGFLLVGCGDDVATLRVELVLQGNPSPLDQVERLRLIATGPSMDPIQAEAPRSAKTLELSEIPIGPDRVITVEGIDKDSVVVARGESDPFELTATSPDLVKLPFASCSSTLYRDVDGDGYGDDNLSKTACAGGLTGYADKKGDCDDGDRDAHPGQTKYFDRPTTGTQGFDFDCDGKETKEHPDLENCRKQPPDCVGEGWDGSVPPCGQSGTFVPCEKGSCGPATSSSMTQGCR